MDEESPDERAEEDFKKPRYGARDCMGWSSALQAENQRGSLPRRSTNGYSGEYLKAENLTVIREDEKLCLFDEFSIG